MTKSIFKFISLLILITYTFTQAQNCQWAKSAGGINYDQARCVSTDSKGNVYITGIFNSSTITFGSTTLTNAGGGDIFIVKYDASGNVLWAKSAGGIYYDDGFSITTDTTGNVIITGNFNSPTINFGSTSLTNIAGIGDIFIAKYDTNGNVLWAKSTGGNDYEGGYSVSTDANSNVYLTGYFRSSTITFGSIILTNAGNFDIFIVKLDALGNVLWAKSIGGTNDDYGNNVSTDAGGYTNITGYFESSTITFGSTTLTNAGGADIFIVKYDAAGNVIWAKSEGSTNGDYGNSVSSDSIGNVYITGYFKSPTISFGSTTLINTGNKDIFIVKYDVTGNLLWAKSAGGVVDDVGTSISADGSGNVYITGYYGATITFGSTLLNDAGGGDIFIAKYDASGNVLWAKRAGGTSDDWGQSVFTDANNIFLTGFYDSNTILLDTTPITNADTSGNSFDLFIAKFDGTSTGFDNLFGIKEFNISPNPTTSTIAITIPKPINTNISITNLTGKQVGTYNIQNTTTKTIDLSNLAEGVYFVTLQSNEGVVTKKIVKTN